MQILIFDKDLKLSGANTKVSLKKMFIFSYALFSENNKLLID